MPSMKKIIHSIYGESECNLPHNLIVTLIQAWRYFYDWSPSIDQNNSFKEVQ